ncbi:MAG: 4-aminobutyrate--2-oxoglutarate transaminase [Actinomycetaceae bacterium]|nr:4-aminobutyrate--2-oxoglutarate transaminase [Actinomycetaceae bacterium]
MSSSARRIVTQLPGPRSKELDKRKQDSVARGVSNQNPIYAVDVGGGIIEDVDGNRFVDLGSGIAVTTVGASHPAVVKAIHNQAERFTHTCFMVTPYAEYVELAEKLNQITPGDFSKKTCFFNSGAECVENAVKIARAYTKKKAVVAFENAYHGRTNLTMSMTGKAVPYKAGFGPFTPEVYRAPMSYPFHDGLDGHQAAQRTITMIERYITPDEVACVIIEPIQGEGGFIVPAPGFLKEVVSYCRDNNIVFIADEVQSGFGRTGQMFACEHEDIEPDIMCTAKGIAAGMPLSAVTGRAEIMDVVDPGGLGGTYGGNPLSCAAGLAVIDEFKNGKWLEKARRIEQILTTRLHKMALNDPRIGEIRGRGAMIGVEFVEPGTTTPLARVVKEVQKKMYNEGVIILTCGLGGNVIRFLPPLSIDEEVLEDALTVLEESLKEVQ